MANFSYNKCFFAGRLTADPELKKTNDGIAVATFSIAVKRRAKAQGASEPQTDFVNCEAWRTQAEVICKYLKKGNSIWVDTSCRQERFTDKNGNNRTSIRFVVNDFQFVESLSESKNSDGEHNLPESANGVSARREFGQEEPSTAEPPAPHFEEVDIDSDLPF